MDDLTTDRTDTKYAVVDDDDDNLMDDDDETMLLDGQTK